MGGTVLSNAALVWSLIYHVMAEPRANGTVVGVFYDACSGLYFCLALVHELTEVTSCHLP